MTTDGLDILLSQNWASPFFHVRFQLLLLDLHTGFTGGSKVAWYSYLLKNFPKFVVIHTVKSFSIVYEVKVDIFWNSLAFPIIQWMSAIWSLVPLPFLNAAWTSRSSQFTHCWSLAWRILNITLLACEVNATVHSLSILYHCLSLGLEWKLTFPVLWPLLSFQACWHIDCSAFRASSFRIGNSSTGIPSPSLALFVWCFLRAIWLSIPGCLALGEWSHHSSCVVKIFFVQFFCVLLPPLLNIFCFC